MSRISRKAIYAGAVTITFLVLARELQYGYKNVSTAPPLGQYKQQQSIFGAGYRSKNSTNSTTTPTSAARTASNSNSHANHINNTTDMAQGQEQWTERGSSRTLTNDQLDKLCNSTNEIVQITHAESIQQEHSQEESLYWKQSLPFFLLTCQELTRSLHTTSTTTTATANRTANRTATNRTSAAADVEDVTATNSSSLLGHELDNNLSFQRLAAKLLHSKLTTTLDKDSFPPPINTQTGTRTHTAPLKIIVIGGSMSTGFVDIARNDDLDTRKIAWPRKLEQFMHQKWGNESVQIVNLSEGGANEITWLGRLDVIMSHSPFDIILVESAVNDQCENTQQTSMAKQVNSSSHLLLNTLMHFPNNPAVISVELFRLAHTNARDANKHCKGEVREVKDGTHNNEPCFYCEQWWKPQDWRKEARERNSVAYASYRDAVWPELENAPKNLCQYWYGLSHPQAGTHALVASTVLFQFMVVLEKQYILLELANDVENRISLERAPTPDSVCLEPISSYRAQLEDPVDPISWEEQVQMQNRSSCWTFKADVRQKYGWICDESKNRTMALDIATRNVVTNSTSNSSDAGNADASNGNSDIASSIHNNAPEHDYFHLHKELRIGGDGKVIISRLVSYDERMASAQVWFSHTVTHANGTRREENVFVGNPVWNILSWVKGRVSIPQPEVIWLSGHNFTDASQMTWKKKDNLATRDGDGEYSSGKAATYLVTFNIMLLVGTSPASRKDDMNGVDKFKLLGIVTC